ncbi:MAG: tetratricopeptide repeat protein, partial [Planctomycetota bacterium]
METTTLFIIPPLIYGDVDYYLIRGLIDLLATSLDLYEGISAMAPIMIEVDSTGKAKRELQNHFRFLGEDSPEEELLEFVERCYPESGAALLPIVHAQGKTGELKLTLRVISHQGRYPLFEMHWHGRILDIVKNLSRDVSLIAEHCGGTFKEDSKFVWPTTDIEEALKCYLNGLALSKNYQAIQVGTNYRQSLNLLFRALDLDSKMEFSAFRIVGFSEFLLENTDLPLDTYNVGLESLKKLSHHYKLSGRVQIFLAQALQRYVTPAQAEKMFQQAIEQNPEDTLVCLEVATFYEQQNKPNLAEQIYQKYLQLHAEGHPDILLNQGVISAKKGNLDEAIAYWKKTLKADPRYHTAFGNLMNAYFDKGDISCMWVFFELGLKQTPVPWKNYENIFQQAGSEKLPDFEPGILYLEEYLRQNPEDSYAYLALAQVLNHLGEKKKALLLAHLARDKASSGVEKG